RPRQFGWWNPDSIEDFSMSNFVVQANTAAVEKFLMEELSKASKSGQHSQESLETILYAANQKLIPWMAKYAVTGSYRTWLFLARTISLMEPKSGENVISRAFKEAVEAETLKGEGKCSSKDVMEGILNAHETVQLFLMEGEEN